MGRYAQSRISRVIKLPDDLYWWLDDRRKHFGLSMSNTALFLLLRSLESWERGEYLFIPAKNRGPVSSAPIHLTYPEVIRNWVWNLGREWNMSDNEVFRHLLLAQMEGSSPQR